MEMRTKNFSCNSPKKDWPKPLGGGKNLGCKFILLYVRRDEPPAEAKAIPLVCPCCRADAGRHLRDCPPRRDPLLGWYAGMDVADANPERDRNTTDRRQYQGVGATIRQRRERTLFKRASAGRRRRSAHGATASHQPRQQRRKSQDPRFAATASH